MGIVILRDLTDLDLPILFEFQREPEGNAMTAFPARDWDAYQAHMAKIRADSTTLNRTILYDGQVAGSIASYLMDGEREVGYWIGKAYWGLGIATQALALFVALDLTRPLYAHAAKRNPASLRVLRKCGFTIIGEDAWSPVAGAEPVEEYVLRLDRPV